MKNDQPVTPILEIQLLASFQLRYDDHPVKALDRSRLQALLAYLLLHRDSPQSRQHLAYLFWPQSSEKQARTNLRNLLHTLRNALPDEGRFLCITSKTVQWREDGPFTLDVARFEIALSSAHRATSPAAARSALEQAVQLYAGPLLPDHYDDWVLVQRERLSQLYADTLRRLLDLLEGQRDYPAALTYAQRLLRHDPLWEETYRLLMRLHALNGDRASALRTYHVCSTVLLRELGVEPSPVTQKAYQRLLRLDERPGTTPLAPMAERLPLVGRHHSWQTLTQAWEDAKRGRPRVALILGEAGIGKTRLAEELLDRVRRQGFTTASSRSYEAEGEMAYAPVTDWLRSEVLLGVVEELEPVWQSEVSRVLPELLARHPGLPPPGPLREGWEQRRFHESLARAFLAAPQPLLMHIDDLQWCDESTLAWLHFLLRSDRRSRLLVVGTVRPEELQADHPIKRWTLALDRSGLFVEIKLDPLNVADTAKLASHAGGEIHDATAAEQLYADTEGSPLFVVETVRARLGPGDAAEDERFPDRRLQEAFDHLRSPSPFLQSILPGQNPLPSRIQAVIERRLAQLSSPARKLAGVAAVIGREFAVPVLEAASGVNEDTLVLALDELWQRRIVRERGVDSYDFSHDKLREVAYVSLSTVRRRMLHRRVATTLESQHPGQLDEISGQLAVHWQQGGELAKARTYLLRAGRYASNRYANDEALAYLTHALDLTKETELDARYEVLRARELVYRLQAARDAQQRDLDLMAALAEALDDDSRRAEVALRRAGFQYELGHPQRAIGFAECAVALAQSGGNKELQAAGLLEWSRSQLDLGTLDAAWEGYEQARDLARSAAAARIEARCLHGLSQVAVDQGDWEASRAFDTQALSIYRELEDARGQALIIRHIGVVDQLDGYPLAGRAKTEEALRLARQIGFLWLEAWVATGLGWASLMTGQFSQALAEQEEALDLARQVEDRSLEVMALNDMIDTLHQLERYDSGLQVARQALAIAQRIGNRLREANSWANMGLLLADLSRAAKSADAYRNALEIYREQGNAIGMLRAQAGLARATWAMGDLAAAFALVEEILPVIEDGAKVISQSDGGAAIYLTCYRILWAAKDGRAREVLQQGYAYVRNRASRIPDPALQGSFLANLREVREIVDAAEQVGS